MKRIRTGQVILLIVVGLLLSACLTTSTVTLPSGEVYTVKCKSDAMVQYEETDGKMGIKIIVDNRGRPGMIEQALGIMFMSLPDVEIKASD